MKTVVVRFRFPDGIEDDGISRVDGVLSDAGTESFLRLVGCESFDIEAE